MLVDTVQPVKPGAGAFDPTAHDGEPRAVQAGSIASSSQPGSISAPKTDLVAVVDDDEICREIAGAILLHAGFGSVSATDGRDLLALLEHTIPQLVLLDLEMPGLSGFEVCKLLKSNPRWAEIPVIFLTGTTDPKVKARAFAAGGADYVIKPIESIELLARIQCHIELARSRTRLHHRARKYEAIATEQMGRLEQVRFGQASLLTDLSTFTDLKLAVRLITANEAGGDFYEIVRLSDDQFGVLVADVAGHDLSVPFMTGALKALAGICLNDGLSPEESLIMLNSGLRKSMVANQYVTACYVKFSLQDMWAEIANAGHPAMLLKHHNGPCEYLESIGDVLGIFEPVRFEPRRITLNKGDRLFLYTDGLTEGYRDEHGQSGRPLFGAEELRRRVEQMPSTHITQTVDAIMDDLIDQNGRAQLGDDVVLLGIEF